MTASPPATAASGLGTAFRPGRVVALKGIIFQCDAGSTIGAWFIRPFEALDRLAAGLGLPHQQASLAMHAGLHVEIEGHGEHVAEQIVGTLYEDFQSGLNWTPIAQFRARDRGGWDVTVPAIAFRGIDKLVEEATVDELNRIEGHPFLGEDCTAFIERAFGGRRLFADSPVLRWFGVGMRIGDPALPLLKPDATLEPRAESLLQADVVRRLPDPLAGAHAPNGHMLARLFAAPTLAAIALVALGVVLVRRRR